MSAGIREWPLARVRGHFAKLGAHYAYCAVAARRQTGKLGDRTSHPEEKR
jgi:hypothetical protein